MLQLNEGKTIDFFVRDKDNKEYTVQGKIIRSGYNTGGDPTQAATATPAVGNASTPIIEVNGQLRFSLPGEPVFPALADDAVLKPTLTWRIAADAPAKLDAELSYITAGLTWNSAYNFVSPEKGDTLDLVGWVTFQNNSGKEFKDSNVKLMAGNVNKVQPPSATGDAAAAAVAGPLPAPLPVVTEKAFDEFHLYYLARPVSLHDHETKQVEFVRADGHQSRHALYIYDGAALENFRGWDPMSIRNNPDYGTQSNKKVWVMREFKNSKDNGLGLAAARRAACVFTARMTPTTSIQFTGENTLDHTPENETVRLYTGDSLRPRRRAHPHRLPDEPAQRPDAGSLSSQSPQPQNHAGGHPRRRTPLPWHRLDHHR